MLVFFVQDLVWLRIGSREDWWRQMSHEMAPEKCHMKHIDLTSTAVEEAIYWWHEGSEPAWLKLEQNLFAAVRLLGQQHRLLGLRTLDLVCGSRMRELLAFRGMRDDSFERDHLDVNSFFSRGSAEEGLRRLVALSEFCPQLQHLRLPAPAGVDWADAMLLWRGLLSLSFNSADADWAAPCNAVSAGCLTDGCSFDSLMSFTAYCGGNSLVNGSRAIRDQEHAALCNKSTGKTGTRAASWIASGGVFANLRRIHLVFWHQRIRVPFQVCKEYLPVLEDLKARFEINGNADFFLTVDSPSLRKLVVSTPGKNSGVWHQPCLLSPLLPFPCCGLLPLSLQRSCDCNLHLARVNGCGANILSRPLSLFLLGVGCVGCVEWGGVSLSL